MKRLNILVGILFLLTVVYAYYQIPERLYEFTAISNTSAGLFLIAEGILSAKGKHMPRVVWQIAACSIMSVYCCTFMNAFNIVEFKFMGGYMFLHAINPIIFMLFYLFTADIRIRDTKDHILLAAVAPVMTVVYMIFDLIRWLLTGVFIYSSLPASAPAVLIILLGTAIYAAEVAVNFLIIRLKLYIAFRLKAGGEHHHFHSGQDVKHITLTP